MRRTQKGFTLVELLVVIGIIALLISVLLPTLGKARAASRSVACRALLKQYGMAAAMYMSEFNGVMVHQDRYLDYNAGLTRYFGVKEFTEKLTRCPADNSSSLATIGAYTSSAATPPDYKIYRKDGTPYTVNVSIGISPSQFSTGFDTSAKWIKPYKYKVARMKSTNGAAAFDSTKTLLFADYQYTPTVALAAPNESTPNAPILNIPSYTTVGSQAFRHNDAFNAVFFDGHVGSVRTKLLLKKGGLELVDGQTWNTYMSISIKHYKYAYPFGPGYEGTKPTLVEFNAYDY